MKHTKKGFTLIELLVVIAIIAVLSVVVILTLNPAELLRQARDSTRISDLNTIKSALSLFLADTASSSGLLGGTNANYTTCYGSKASVITTSACSIFFTKVPLTTASSGVADASSTAVNGSGWIPVNLTAVSAGSPIGSFPIDPVNSSPTIYFYRASGTAASFKVAGKMESSKYGTSGTGDVQTNDGGNSVNYFEVGTDLSL